MANYYIDKSKVSINQLIENNLELVKKIAWQIFGRVQKVVEVEDLIQQGMEGLGSAAQKSSPKEGVNFQQYAQDIKEIVNIPILRKDFIIDEWQIYESFYYGADCILLILAILDDTKAKKFLKLAHELGMDVITEIHDYEELKRAIEIGAQCIGINNRNLKTLEIDINLFKKLSKHIPQNIIKVCESGISENNQLKKINEEGADAFLIGEFLMKQRNIYNATKDLIQK